MGLESGLLAAAVAAFIFGWGGTWLCCRPGSWLYFLDHPNARSLHVRPTPRTGAHEASWHALQRAARQVLAGGTGDDRNGAA